LWNPTFFIEKYPILAWLSWTEEGIQEGFYSFP